MSITSWPFHNGSSGTPVYEDQWTRMARQWAPSGVVGYPLDSQFQVYANNSGREVHVRAGVACVRGHWVRSTAEETLPVAANPSGDPRADRVVLRLDPSANSITLAVLTGTPAGGIIGPLPPTPETTDTGVYDLPLAVVNVGPGVAAITAPDVSDERVYASPPPLTGASGRVPLDPAPGQLMKEADTGLLRAWDGAQWETVNADLLEEWVVVAVAAPYATQPAAAAAKFKYWRRGTEATLAGSLNRTVSEASNAVLVAAGAMPTPQAERRFNALAVNNTTGAWTAAPCQIYTDGTLVASLPSAGAYSVFFDSCFYTI
jgi:hypothetical protein